MTIYQIYVPERRKEEEAYREHIRLEVAKGNLGRGKEPIFSGKLSLSSVVHLSSIKRSGTRSVIRVIN